MNTEGLWYTGEKKLEIRTMEIPESGSDEVVVELEACGLCSWDILSFNGRYSKYHPYPFCAGHEGVGRVIRIGEKVENVKEGDRVVMHELPIGHPGGALLARHAIRSERQLAVIPKSDLPVHLWIVEPAVCIVNGIIYAHVQPGDRVAVVGSGYMGLLFIQALKRCLTGNITAFDVIPQRLELAQKFGADDVLAVESGRIPHNLQKSFDIVIETAGNVDSITMAIQIVRAGGVIENFAWHHHNYTFDLEDWHINGWRILNIQPGMNPHFADLYPRTVALMANGTLSNVELVTHVAPIERALELYTVAAEKPIEYIKGVIIF